MSEITFNLADYRAEDGGILDAWIELYGQDWLYVTGYECWYQWAGTHWQRDECQAIYRQVQALMDAMNKAARDALLAVMEDEDMNDDERDSERRKWLAYIDATKRSKARIISVVTMAQAQRAVGAGMLDAGNILNLKNGTLDLGSIELRGHNRSDHLTYCLGYEYDPDAVTPTFEKYLVNTLVKEQQDAAGLWETDLELCALVRAAMGYSLTNDMRHEVMFWLSGTGGNGKSVLIKTINALLGYNAIKISLSTLGTTDGNYRLAKLVGKRVVFCAESKKGGTLAEELIKEIADGSEIDARPIYGEPFTFRSQAKIWWAMNDKPVIKSNDNSIWRRLRLIPFYRTFAGDEVDVDLFDRLQAELSGILNFALDGLQELREKGWFPESAAVTQAIQEYKKESNPTLQWLDERTVELKEPTTLGSALYADYTDWCDKNGRKVINSTNFGTELKKLGVPYRDNARGKDGRVGNRYARGLAWPTQPTQAVPTNATPAPVEAADL